MRYGPYRGIAGVRAWNPRTGTYGRAGAAWGPRGSAGFVGAYNPRTDGAGYVAGGRNVYGAWKSAGVKRGSEWARVTARDTAAGGSALRWNTSNGQGFIREGRRGDIYAGRDGNVYRNTGDGWQRFDGGWQDVCTAGTERSFSNAAKGARASRRRPVSGCRSVGEARLLEASPAPVPPVPRAPPLASGWAPAAKRLAGIASTGAVESGRRSGSISARRLSRDHPLHLERRDRIGLRQGSARRRSSARQRSPVPRRHNVPRRSDRM